MNKEDLTNKQGMCPRCKEYNLNYGSVRFEGDYNMYFPYTCNNCELEGEEWYSFEFTNHIIYDEDGNEIEVE